MAAVPALFINPVLSTIFSRMFSLLFGGPSPQQNLTQTLQVFLNTLSRDFARVVDDAMRAAFLDHSFDQIKVDTVSAMSHLRDYSYSRDPNLLNNAHVAITQAASRLQVLYDRIYKELYIDPFPEQLNLPDKSKQYAALLKTQEKVEKAFYVLKTVASIDLLITAERVARDANLAPTIRLKVQQYGGDANKVKDMEGRWLTFVINSVSVDILVQEPKGELSVAGTYFGNKKVAGTYTPHDRKDLLKGTLALQFEGGSSKSVPVNSPPRRHVGSMRFVGITLGQTLEKCLEQEIITHVIDDYHKNGTPLRKEAHNSITLWNSILD